MSKIIYRIERPDPDSPETGGRSGEMNRPRQFRVIEIEEGLPVPMGAIRQEAGTALVSGWTAVPPALPPTPEEP